MTSGRTHSDYLVDIREAANKAIQFLGRMSEQEFAADDTTVFAVIRAIEVLGEAAKQIPTETREKYAAVPWRSMSGIRDKLIHGYMTVDLAVV